MRTWLHKCYLKQKKVNFELSYSYAGHIADTLNGIYTVQADFLSACLCQCYADAVFGLGSNQTVIQYFYKFANFTAWKGCGDRRKRTETQRLNQWPTNALSRSFSHCNLIWRCFLPLTPFISNCTMLLCEQEPIPISVGKRDLQLGCFEREWERWSLRDVYT